MDICIDRTIINLVTLLVSGMGIFAALTKYSAPELSKSYWGENPFAFKRDKIDAVMTWIFTFLVICGLLFHALTLILVHDIPDRNYGVVTYATVFFTGLFVMLIVVFLLTKAGKMIARKRWLPEIIRVHRGKYETAKFIVEHNGRLDNQIEQNDLPDKNIQRNYKDAEKHISQIERLLDIPHDKTDLSERLDRMRRYFV